MPDRSPHAKGVILAVAGVIALSPDSLLIRLIETDTWTLLFWRGLLVAIGLTAWIWMRRGLWTSFQAVGRKGWLAGGILATGTTCFVLAITHTTVANTLIIMGAGPLFAAIFSRTFLGEPVALRTWIAIAAVLGGISVIVSGNLQSGLLFGDLCALANACLLGGHMVVLRSAPKVDMTPSVVLGGLLASAAVFPMAAPGSVEGNDILLLLLLGLVVLPLSFGMIVLALRYLPAPEVSLLLLLEMVLGPYWVWLVLGERPGMRTVIGGGIVMATLGLHSAIGQPKRARKTGKNEQEVHPRLDGLPGAETGHP